MGFGEPNYSNNPYTTQTNYNLRPDPQTTGNVADNDRNWFEKARGVESGEDHAYRPEKRGYLYAGQFGGAAADVDRNRSLASQAASRGAAYNMHAGDQAQARGMQNEAIANYARILAGGRSEGQRQFSSGMREASEGASGLAAGARGGGSSMAAARSAAMRQQGLMGSSGNAQLDALRARERQAAAVGMASMGADMRSGDQAWQRAMYENAAAGRALNDQRELGFERNAYGTNQAQLAAQIEYERAKQEAELAQRGQNERVGQRNADRDNRLFQGIMGAAGGAANQWGQAASSADAGAGAASSGSGGGIIRVNPY